MCERNSASLQCLNGCHPDYAPFLLDKQTLHVQDIHAILSGLGERRRGIFDCDYIAEEYLKYINRHVGDSEAVTKLSKAVGNRPVLIIALGKSLGENEAMQKLQSVAREGNYYVISVNFMPSDFPVDMIFVSNMKRFDGVRGMTENAPDGMNIVVTSNITTQSNGKFMIVNYFSYINEEQSIVDNAGLMCINLLKRIGTEQILLAGFDGFSARAEENYFAASMYMDVGTEHRMEMNAAVARKLNQLKLHMQIDFFAESAYLEEKSTGKAE